MSRTRRPADQLPLQLSVEASADLSQALAVAQGEIEALQAELASASQHTAKLTAKVERLTREKKKDERNYQRLIDQYNKVLTVKLGDEDHPLYKENQDLKRSNKELDRLVVFWVKRAMGQQQPSRSGADPLDNLTKDTLTKLLFIAHPDRWSQGQPATTLAHELTVMINQLRARRGGAV